MLRGFFPLIDTARHRRHVLLAALVVGACGDDGTEATSSNTISGTDTSTSESDPSDPSDTSDTSSAGTVDPDSSSGPGESSESSGPGESSESSGPGESSESSGPGESSESSGPGESSESSGSTSVGPACGNDVIEDAEICDGVDLAGEDCIAQGFEGGVLGCADDCTAFDTSNCTDASCAHDLCVEGEVLVPDCDTCVEQICAVDPFCCNDSWDATCVNQVTSICGIVCPGCGNDVIEGDEVCDGTDLALEDCITQGLPDGTLGCTADCTAFDTSLCTGLGDGDCCVANGSPGCNDAACEDSVCAADPFCCNTQWDIVCANAADADPNCATAASCVSDCCAAHGTPGCDDDACEASVCAADPFCCNNQWDVVCTNNALVDPNCASACGGGGAVCGDNLAEGTEACDGADLVGEDCITQGFDGGVLACAGDCTGFDTSGCTEGPSDCCVAHLTPGCDDAACEASVCAVDPFCCNSQWDVVCTNTALVDPNCAAVCGGAVFACQDQGIGGTIGPAVAAGNTLGSDDDLDPSCGAGNANDEVIAFTAPLAAQYTFNTDGSNYDTVMALFSDCATQLACDDDSGVGTQSQIVRNLAAGEVVLILVDGFNGSTGAWTLNISSP